MQKCPKCKKEMISIEGFNPSNQPFVQHQCKCGHREEQIINEPPKIKISLGSTPELTKIYIDNKQIKNCESFLITANTKEVRAYLSILHLPTDIELKHWDTSFKLMGTKEEQISCLEAVLDKLKKEGDETESRKD